MRTVALRVCALALLLLLILVSTITVRMLNRLPNSVVYFVSQGSTSTLEGVRRRFDADTSEAQLWAALTALIEGTNEVGLSSAFPPDTEVRGLERTESHVIVDLSKAFAEGRDVTIRARLNQLFYTLSQPTDIDSVSLRIEGQPVYALGGVAVPQPWQEDAEGSLPTW